jgi:hypothetical protein
VYAEKAVSAGEKQECQVLMDSVGHKIGRLERTSAGNGQEIYVKKRGKMPHLRGKNGP